MAGFEKISNNLIRLHQKYGAILQNKKAKKPLKYQTDAKNLNFLE